MTRIPGHTIADAPEASRPLLEGVVQFSPTGKPLNLHAQMAHSPAVLAAYTGIRQATAAHGTLPPQVRPALMLATAGVTRNAYAEAITAQLALGAGWSPAQASCLRNGQSVGDEKADSLVRVVREAAARAGQVSDPTWQQATAAGWTSQELAEAFAYVGLTLFTAYFLTYAQTPLDLPAGPPADVTADVTADVPAAGRRA